MDDDVTNRTRGRGARRIKRAAAGVLGFVFTMTALIGFMHTRAGRPLLMKLAGVAGCPVGHASAAQIEAARLAAVARERGATPAPARPAFGFELDGSTLADVRAWERRGGISCSEERGGTFVRCDDVPASAIGMTLGDGAVTEVAFGFAPSGRLVTVTALTERRDAGSATRLAEVSRQALASALGAPTTEAGSFARVGGTATLRYRFSDYSADLTASRVPGSAYAVREQVMSAR
jgi:hypothetical protein